MPFPSRLIDGYRAFLVSRLRKEQAQYRELADRGQSPEVMVIGCCNSRVSPEVIFDAGPGELFVVRNVANLVPPYAPDGKAHGVSAALEFGVVALKVKHIVVLGHAQCGGVKAFAEDSTPLTPTDFIGQWMTLMAPAADIAGPRGDLPLGDYITQLEAGQCGQQPQQPDDLPAPARARRARRDPSARRLLRRCRRQIVGTGRRDRRVHAGGGRRLYAHVRDAAVLMLFPSPLRERELPAACFEHRIKTSVINGLVPVISARDTPCSPKRDGRDKPGHDASLEDV